MANSFKPLTPQMGVPLSFVHARLRGRRRRAFEGPRLEELQRKRSVRELWHALYPREPAVGRIALERRLRADRLRELCSLVHLLSPAIADFYRALLRRFQVDNILVLLRLFAGGGERAEPAGFLELPRQLAVSSGQLLSSPNIEEFIAQLPRPLAQEAQATAGLYAEYGTTAFTEMALERAWWRGVREGLGNISRRFRSHCSAPLFMELAYDRLLAVLRAARDYDIPWDHLRPRLPPAVPDDQKPPSAMLSDQQLREMFEAPTARNINQRLSGIAFDPGASLVDLEEKMWQRTFRTANRIYYSVMDGPSILVSYFYIRRNELKNLIKTVESTHYGR